MHVLDLLVEDLAKLKKVASIGAEAHFAVSFVKKHALLLEEFSLIQQRNQLTLDLLLFPATRFAYMYLMVYRVHANIAALRLLSESPIFAHVLSSTKARGKEGHKAVEEFNRFETFVTDRSSKLRLSGCVTILKPFSIALHYLEGDNVPMSHIFPVFQLMYDFSQQLDDFPVVTSFLSEEEERDEVASCVRKRWLGHGRLVGLKADVHLLAFVLDPYVQATLTTAKEPTCDLLAGEALQGARTALRHYAIDDPDMRSSLLHEFGLWCAAVPQLGENPSTSTQEAEVSHAVHPSGNNAYSSLRLAAMLSVWEELEKHEQALTTDAGEAMLQQLAKLRHCPKPTRFWLSMMNEVPRTASAKEKADHRSFCRMAADVSAIVAHTCGVERAGKAYDQVLTPMRKKTGRLRALKAAYVYLNYNLMHGSSSNNPPAQRKTNASESRGDSSSVGAISIRRGSLILDDVREGQVEPYSSDDDTDSEEEGADESSGEEVSGSDAEEEASASEPIREIRWHIPPGFVIAPEPRALDKELVGQYVYMRWEAYGWQLGRITHVITKDTPRLFAKFNFRVAWSDGSKGPAKLDVHSFAHGPHARVDSWVLLKPT